MRFLIVGAGAIGGLVGGRLAAAGYDVTLVGRGRLVDILMDSGLRLNISGETIYVPEITAVTTVDEAVLEFGPFDVTLFTMKSYDTAAAVRDLRAVLGFSQSSQSHPILVVSLQNGVGNEEQLREAFGAEQVVAGVIMAPAEMPVPGVIRASTGSVGFAPLVPATSITSLVSAFRSAELKPHVYADWRALKWSKLLLNMLGNAVSAILDWPPAQVFGDPRTFALEWRAWQEALDVIRAQGLEVVALPGYPLPWLVRLLPRLPRPLLQPLLQRAIAGGRGGKMPSLHMDLSRGKTQSEVVALNGAVVQAGHQLGVPTPVNTVLTETLMGIVQKKLDWDMFRGQPDRLLALVEEKNGQQEHIRS